MLSYPSMPHQIAITSDSKTSDLTVQLFARAGRNFDFTLKGNHLRVQPTSKGTAGNDDTDWFTAISEKEKIGVMSKVLANYRLPSLHAGKWKVSAIGITRNPDENAPKHKRHLAFVGVNTDMRSEQLDKACGEQGMLDAMVNNIAQYQYHKRGVMMTSPAVPMELHLMGGREPDPANPDDKGERMIAPCGKCTDTLAQWMQPEDVIYIYPVNNGNMPLKVNDTAFSLDEVKGNEVWKTTIGHLNRLRHIDLNAEAAAQQRAGMEALVHQLLQAPQEVPDAVADQAWQNTKQRRQSIPELDIATRNGKPLPAAMNAYLHAQIVDTLRSRLDGAHIPHEAEAVRHWLEGQMVETISASVVQFEDGTYTPGLKAISQLDSASTSSQLSALNSNAGVKKSGHQGIVHGWSMNFSVADILAGKTTTPSKDGIERQLKKMNGQADAKPFTHFIFNDGALAPDKAETLAQTYNWSAREIFPGGFKGGKGRGTGCGCGHGH